MGATTTINASYIIISIASNALPVLKFKEMNGRKSSALMNAV
jgi:hypothetical protein